MGTGNEIIEGIVVGNETMVSAGGVVVKDINEQGIYIGVPVRRTGRL